MITSPKHTEDVASRSQDCALPSHLSSSRVSRGCLVNCHRKHCPKQNWAMLLRFEVPSRFWPCKGLMCGGASTMQSPHQEQVSAALAIAHQQLSPSASHRFQNVNLPLCMSVLTQLMPPETESAWLQTEAFIRLHTHFGLKNAHVTSGCRRSALLMIRLSTTFSVEVAQRCR